MSFLIVFAALVTIFVESTIHAQEDPQSLTRQVNDRKMGNLEAVGK
jgi:hypothetical protein